MANTLKFGNGQWATGNGTALAYNDENANFKPLPFDFTRASSGTTINQSGLIETVGSGIPRIDFQGNTKGALLLEPSRTNLFTYSEEFSNASVWGKVNTTFTDNETTSPSGLLTGKLTRNVTTFSCIRDTTISTTLGSTYVFSTFYKKDTETTINHSILNENTGYVTFNFDTETISITRNDNGNTISTDGFGFEKYPNGWYRIYLKFVRKAGSLQLQVARQDSGVIGQSTFIYGAQIEEGSYATSYIPTSGSAVTRVADSCIDGANEQVINSTEGVLYLEISALSDDGTNRFIILNKNNDSNNNRLTFRYQTSSNQLSMEVHIGGVLKMTLQTTLADVTVTQKVALKYKQNDYAFWVNGVEVSVNTLSEIWSPNTLNNIDFTGFGQNFVGKCKDLRVYNEALTDLQLQKLTTL